MAATRSGAKALSYFERRRREIAPLVRSLFAFGPRMYRGPLAALLGRWNMLLLVTTGRRTGLPRTVVLTFMALGRDYLVGAGMGERCDWYRNLVADPAVTIQVGRRRMRARAVPLLEPERRRELTGDMVRYWDRYGPPGPLRWVLRRFGFDYDGEMVQAVVHAEELPLVRLVPD